MYGAPCSERNTVYMSPVNPHYPKGNLTCLDVTGMGLSTRIPNPERLRHITTVYADHMRLQEVPLYVFNVAPLMELLDLSGNKITRIPKDTFLQTPHLKILLLSDNRIVVPRRFPLLKSKSLHTLVLSNNGIRRLSPYTFRQVRKLKVLYLDRNRLIRISPKVFKPLKQLKYLHLGGNQLKELPPNLLVVRPQNKLILITKGNPLNSLNNTRPVISTPTVIK